jgi:hypothetical protein
MSTRPATAATFRRLALALAETVEAAHMNHPDFRRGGRIFATIHPDGGKGGLKLTPDQQVRFVGDFPKAFEPAAGAWGRQGWTYVTFASANEEVLGEALTLAWQNLGVTKKPAAKRQRAAGASRIRESVTKRR